MSIPIDNFWRLLVESRLLTPEDCQRLNGEFGHVKGAAQQGNSRTLSEWLVSRNVISRYQASLLQAGRPGPFLFGDYRSYDRVDDGALAGCFRAMHVPTGHPVILKFLQGPVVQDQQRWVAAANRSRHFASLVDPIFWRTYELIDLTSYKIVVMEDLKGRSLAQLLQSAGRLPAGEACRILYQTAMNLSQLHQMQQPHGSISPEAIWIENTGNVRLIIDPVEPAQPVNVASNDPAMLARADYMAPELGRSGRVPDLISDIYALGATFYQMLVGEVAFPGGTAAQKLARHAAEPLQQLDQKIGLPPQVMQLLSYMMAKNAGVRFQQVSAVAEQAAALSDPATLHPQPLIPAPTLPAYLQAIQQKQQSLGRPTATAAPASPVVAPAINLAQTTASTTSAGSVAATTTTAPIQSSDSQESIQSRRKKKKDMMPWMIGGGIGAACLLALLLLVAFGGGGDDDDPSDDPAIAAADPSDADTTGQGGETDDPPGKTPASPKSALNPDGGGFEASLLTKDDGTTPVAPESSGNAIDLAYVPPSPEMMIVARPADILASSTGNPTLKALGPDFALLRGSWERASKISLDQVEQIIISLHDNGDRRPRVTTVVRLNNQVDFAQLWGSAGTDDGQGARSEAGGWARFIPPGSEGRIFVMGAKEDVDQVKSAGTPPLLGTQMKRLLTVSDNNRHVNIFFVPSYVRSGAQPLFAGKYRKLIDKIDWLFGNDVRAAMLSLHLDTHFHAELRVESTVAPIQYNQQLAEKIEQIPTQIEDYIAKVNPPTYWRKMAFRYPRMLGLLKDQTRYAVENKQAVAAVSLPGVAAPNLVAASELTIASVPGSGTPVASDPKTPQTIEELLLTKMDLAFPQMAFNTVMQAFADDIMETHSGLPFKVEIKVLGSDLELEGITRNQEIRDVRSIGMPMGEILTGILMKGNPDQTVTKPSDPNQKLVWAVGEDPPGSGTKKILITTRVGAKKRNLTLAAPFVE